MSEGYLILATGPAKYAEMARNLAASLRVMDGTRRICLVHDEAFRPEAADEILFDDYATLESDPLYPGFMNKIRIFETCNYVRTMFVDADCLLVKRDVETWWTTARERAFAITGTRRTRGEWKGADIAHLLQQEGAPYLVQMNSGVFCFDRSSAAATFFEGLNEFYLRRRASLGVGLHRGVPTQTDEIYIGLWMGLNGLDAVQSKIGADSWMSSTWRGFGYKLDAVRGRTTMRKPIRSTLGVPNPLLGWEKLSPSFVHFIGLKPRSHYVRLARYFRGQVQTRSHQ